MAGDEGSSGPNSGVEIVTFGCRLNTYESDVIRTHALAAGLSNTIILNSCAVTNEAEKQLRQSIRKLRRENPDARIVVTGCAAQINPERYTAMPEIDHVMGNEAKLKLESYRALDGVRLNVSDIHAVREATPELATEFGGSERAFVQVQNGCNHSCTFCIIPEGRGGSRSVPIGVVAQHVAALLDRNYREIVFTGVDIASYGHDLPGSPTLGQMVRRVLALNPRLQRLRLSSLDPAAIDDDIWHLIAHEPRLMPHLHLSVQAGDDMVLKRMKRRHNRQDVIAIANRARALRPDMVLGADIIAGFPTEDDAMFMSTANLVEEAGLTWLHIFPFSPRAGTPAARMPQVDGDVRKARAAILREHGDKAVSRLLAGMVGSHQRVLVEKNERGHILGRTPNYAHVRFRGAVQAGELADVTITGLDGTELLADMIAQKQAA